MDYSSKKQDFLIEKEIENDKIIQLFKRKLTETKLESLTKINIKLPDLHSIDRNLLERFKDILVENGYLNPEIVVNEQTYCTYLYIKFEG